MPVGPTLRVEFGLDRKRVEGRDLVGRFQLTVAIEGQGPEMLVDVKVHTDDEDLWHRRSVSLAPYELQHLTMCLSTSVEGGAGDAEQVAVWANPSIQSRRERLAQVDRRQRITDQERRVREQNLEALGYVE